MNNFFFVIRKRKENQWSMIIILDTIYLPFHFKSNLYIKLPILINHKINRNTFKSFSIETIKFCFSQFLFKPNGPIEIFMHYALTNATESIFVFVSNFVCKSNRFEAEEWVSNFYIKREIFPQNDLIIMNLNLLALLLTRREIEASTMCNACKFQRKEEKERIL